MMIYEDRWYYRPYKKKNINKSILEQNDNPILRLFTVVSEFKERGWIFELFILDCDLFMHHLGT